MPAVRSRRQGTAGGGGRDRPCRGGTVVFRQRQVGLCPKNFKDHYWCGLFKKSYFFIFRILFSVDKEAT